MSLYINTISELMMMMMMIIIQIIIIVIIIITKLNHLFFMDDLKLYARNENQLDSLIQTIRIVSKDIGMKFGMEKCAVLVLKRGRLAQSEGTRLPDKTTMRAMRESKGYKYLGVLEVDGMLHDTMKKKIGKEYLCRVRKVAQSKFNGGNLIRAINTWAVSLVRYSGGIVDWKKQELQDLDCRTRKLLTMSGGFHSQDCVKRLKEGGRGLGRRLVNQAGILLETYVQSSEEKILKAVRRKGVENQETAASFKERRRTENTQGWKEMPLCGQRRKA